jgi:hypothetical protein
MDAVIEFTEPVRSGSVIRPVYDPNAGQFLLGEWRGNKVRSLPALTLSWYDDPDATKQYLIKSGCIVSSRLDEYVQA